MKENECDLSNRIQNWEKVCRNVIDSCHILGSDQCMLKEMSRIAKILLLYRE